MARICLETFIAAAPERCFDLARSVDLHVGSMAHTRERAVAGVMRGLMALGDRVTWEAKHFGVRQRLTTHITEFERPERFVDEQVRGAFARMRHEHRFRAVPGGTLMTDNFDYTIPFGWLGIVVDKLVLERYMRKLLRVRNEFVKQAAESCQDITKQ